MTAALYRRKSTCRTAGLPRSANNFLCFVSMISVALMRAGINATDIIETKHRKLFAERAVILCCNLCMQCSDCARACVKFTIA